MMSDIIKSPAAQDGLGTCILLKPSPYSLWARPGARQWFTGSCSSWI